jgi:sulfate adenylyltransferase subunit 2
MTTHNQHLDMIEAEAIYILREVAAQFERPILLFSGGKDSIILTHLAHKAFWPAAVPFPLLHIDTGHNFPETIAYRDALAQRLGVRLLVRYVQDSIDGGRVVEETGPYASRNGLQTVTLLDALTELRVEAAIGGARRDEEKARAKERFFSHRDAFGQWDPKNQRPELWNLYNGRKQPNESFRIFPISNWTELDVWHYLEREQIPLPNSLFCPPTADYSPPRNALSRLRNRLPRRGGAGGNPTSALPHHWRYDLHRSCRIVGQHFGRSDCRNSGCPPNGTGHACRR